MTEKLLGYMLLFAGIIVILLAMINIYFVFTKRSEPVNLFTLPGISIDMSQAIAGSLPEALRAQMQSTSASKQEIISAEMVNQPMNLFAQTILMGFIASAGLKLAEIGTMLLRPIVVTVKEKSAPESHL